MGRKKRYRGHYCKVCGRILPNEKFSGKGHAAHICKECTKLPAETKAEGIALNRIDRVYRYMDLSRQNRRMLEDYARSTREPIRLAAEEALASFQPCFPSEDIEDGDVVCRDPENDTVFEDDAGHWEFAYGRIPF